MSAGVLMDGSYEAATVHGRPVRVDTRRVTGDWRPFWVRVVDLEKEAAIPAGQPDIGSILAEDYLHTDSAKIPWLERHGVDLSTMKAIQ